jgi:NADH dehydrogenase FAD-containing subunit
VPLGDPILEVRRVAYTFNQLPAEARRSQIDTRAMHYRFQQGNDVRPPPHLHRIAVVGGGYSGASLAVQMVRRAPMRGA